MTLALLGNPNCGKTTLFNALTGARLKTANWPGVTVEKKEGLTTLHGRPIRLIDLPGTYSLTTYTLEEQITRQYVLHGHADVLLHVADASALERSLYLTLQLLTLGRPTVLALNMMDVAEKRGIQIDTRRLSDLLGIPVIPLSARRRQGLDALLQAAARCQGHPPARLPAPRDPYARIEEILAEVLTAPARPSATDRADALLAHPVWGLPIFLLLMALVFLLTFTAGGWLRAYLQALLDAAASSALAALESLGLAPPVRSLLVDGLLAGVGGVLTFLPSLVLLFTALAVLEDTGYMARAAWLLDGLMGRIGLSGRAFLPLMLGFGCTVPAVLAARTLEDPHDRRKTLLLTPFMSCSARLPLYVLFSQLFFGKFALPAACSMYLLGLLTAILAALLLRLFDKRTSLPGGTSLLIELPDYKPPTARTLFLSVWEKTKDYLTKAGTTIFAASLLLWLLLHFGPTGYTPHMAQTYGAQLGRFLVPLLAPIGLGFWQIAAALLAGLSAKEVVASSCMVLFHAPGGSALLQALTALGFGPANAFALMTFTLLYTPCAAALAAIRRESGSTLWTLSAALFQTAAAWAVTFAVYHIALFL